MLKKLFMLTVGLVIAAVVSFYAFKGWLSEIVPSAQQVAELKQTKMHDIPYLVDGDVEYRGKILAVVTNVGEFAGGNKTGYELTELARAYWVFKANGFNVDIASPEGGEPPVVLDGDDMGRFDYAFLNDPVAQSKSANTLLLKDINPLDYQAVYFVGGKGAMFDFPNNPSIKTIAKELYQNNRVVSAVCHGPAALLNVVLDTGELLVANKTISGFTNEEELLLIPDAREIFPFLLEDKLIAQGANFSEGLNYLEHISHDGKLITGQNPWSVWKLAESVVEELGYAVKPRALTQEEHSILLVQLFHEQGIEAAKQQIFAQPQHYVPLTILTHALVAFMQFEISQGIALVKLTNILKNQLDPT
ncbi:type 1 glutamine amidotransferase domain-containing protein [Alteromonas facilis]|uniref:type 1 glutamine amidotransferase domain-containing protein n=1 Tax=Alteromonas facilis TaxID=2048004 RepID=UPI000C286899|nr:type 1 glutamine amidotransferase domain-containing protein [Alteromonas facilis]